MGVITRKHGILNDDYLAALISLANFLLQISTIEKDNKKL